MEITKNTKVDWLLNYKAIKNQIQTADLALKTKINNRTSTLTYDMTNGFLSANYTLGGKTTYYNTASTLITNYTAVSDLSTALVTNMTDAAIDKQTEELEELIRILTGEIETLEGEIGNLTSEYNSNYSKISNASKGKSVYLSNYYITNAGGSITVTWTISDSTRNYALNSITSAYKDSSTGVITKKQTELDEYTTEKTKAENKIKEIAPEKSTYNKEGSGNGSTDDYDDRGYKKNPDAGSNNDDKTSADKDEASNTTPYNNVNTNYPGDAGSKVTIKDKEYEVYAYTPDGKCIYKSGILGTLYTKDENGNMIKNVYINVRKNSNDNSIYTIDGQTYNETDLKTSLKTVPNYTSYPGDAGTKVTWKGVDYKVYGYTPDGKCIYKSGWKETLYTKDADGNMVTNVGIGGTDDGKDGFTYTIDGQTYDESEIKDSLLD